MNTDDPAAAFLLNYVKVMAERNGYAPRSDFEYRLFDAVGADGPSELITAEDRDNLRYLAGRTNLWVTYDLETNDFTLIDAYEWIDLRTRE